MLKALGLALLLAIFWLINSGYFLPLLLSFGVASVALTVWLMRRVDVIDNFHHPIIMPTLRLPLYLLWLAKEVVKANWSVICIIWSPKCAISPTIVKVKASQKTDTARAFYANSITMTPGTVTLDICDDEFEIHALTQAGADDLLDGEMDRRMTKLEGSAC